jgi:hypothetical protein
MNVIRLLDSLVAVALMVHCTTTSLVVEDAHADVPQEGIVSSQITSGRSLITRRPGKLGPMPSGSSNLPAKINIAVYLHESHAGLCKTVALDRVEQR